MGSSYSPISPVGIPQYLPVLPTIGFLLLAKYKREMRKTMPCGNGWLGGNSALEQIQCGQKKEVWLEL